MNTFFKDIQYGMRSLLKRPGFAAIAIITLALGIGANTTLFSFVNGVLLRPLPYKDAERLVGLDETNLKQGVESFSVSYPNFVDWRKQNTVFEDIGVFQESNYTLVGGGDPEQIPGARVSQGMFEILGVAPIMGRTINADEDRPETNNAVILSYGLWQQRFGADPNVVGRSLSINSV